MVAVMVSLVNQFLHSMHDFLHLDKYHNHYLSILFLVIPPNAEAVPGECSFDKTLCGWKNETRLPISKPGQLLSSVSKDSLISHKNAVSSIRSNLNDLKVVPVSWKLASSNVRPANLQDHTFRAPGKTHYISIIISFD